MTPILKKRNSKNKSYKKQNVKSIHNDILSNKTTALLLLVLIALTFFIYASILKADFVNWDDPYMVTNNEQVLNDFSFNNIIDIFNPNSLNISEYQPLTTLFYHLICLTFGLNAPLFHLLSLFLHLISIMLVFIFVRKLFESNILSISVAALFALHPFNVEAVAWISALNYALFTPFFLLSLIFYIQYIKTDFNKKYLVISVILFAFALLAKSTAVVLPIVLFAVDFFYVRKFNFKIVSDKIPFLILAFICGLIALNIKSDILTSSVNVDFTFLDRIIFAFYSFAFYLIKIFIPSNLKIVYPYPEKINGLLPLEFYLIPLLIILFLIILFLVHKKYRRLIVFSVFFFVANLAVVLHIIPFYHIGIIADRYAYIAGLGIFILFIKLVLEYKPKIIALKYLTRLSLILYILVLSRITSDRIGIWENDKTLYAEMMSDNSHTFVAYNNLGAIKKEDGDLHGALNDFSTAIEINQSYAEAFYNRGNVFYELDSFHRAIEDYNKAIELNPDYAWAFYNRGLAFNVTGNIQLACKDWDKAVALGYADALFMFQNHCLE